jgi:ribosome-associated toxin RatA of RatAB toxin-antitoxin module
MPMLTETYISHVSVDPKSYIVASKSIETQRVDSIASRWKLGEHADGCEVDFSVELSVSDPLLATTLDHVLQLVAGKQVEAFAQRCKQLSILDDTSAELYPKQ